MNLLDYGFMQNALLVGNAVAVAAAVTGWFVVQRRQSFAAHAIANLGFPGAAGAILVGLSPYAGLFAFALAGAVAIALLGERLHERDVSVGMVLVLALGVGVLFLNLYMANANAAFSILFGNMLGIDRTRMWLSIGAVLGELGLLAAIARPLLFATLSPEAAQARGVPVWALNMAFLLLLAVAIAIAIPAIGALLVFALVIGPPAAARLWAGRVVTGIVLAVVLGMVEATGGVLAAWFIGYPTSFWIVGLAFAAYLASVVLAPRLRR